MTTFQKRYLDHQAKKKAQLIEIMSERRSQRNFNGQEIPKEVLTELLTNMANTPSSCNRQAITAKIIAHRHEKELLSGLLVGGVGWVHRADAVLLIFADPEAYLAEGEIKFMPYLDAGVVIYATQLLCQTLGLGQAYINPNIREHYRKYFKEQFNASNLIYCGAIALGYYDKQAEKTPKKKTITEK